MIHKARVAMRLSYRGSDAEELMRKVVQCMTTVTRCLTGPPHVLLHLITSQPSLIASTVHQFWVVLNTALHVMSDLEFTFGPKASFSLDYQEQWM